MKKTEPKTKVSIVLIKQGVTIDNVVKVKDDVHKMPIDKGKYTLYYKDKLASVPKWVTNFFQGTDIKVEKLMSKSVSAVILYQIAISKDEERIFALCFGYGRSLISDNIIEDRFGLLVALNSLEENSLRSLDVSTLDSTQRNSRIQSTYLTNIENFFIDSQKDLLKSISGKSTNCFFYGTLTGTSSLSVYIDKKYNDMGNLLIKCYTLFKSDKYKKNFEWVDRIKCVKDDKLKEELNDQMLKQLNTKNPQKVWISIPEITDYASIDIFKLRKEEFNDIDINCVKSAFKVVFDQKNINDLKILCYSSNGVQIANWSIRRCLYAEIMYQDRQYFHSDRNWYEIDNDFVNIVNEFYKEAPISKVKLPNLEDMSEDEYNKFVVKSNEKEYCLMDKKLISAGNAKIEFCDIYTAHKQLIHVKKYYGSFVLSHLFSQGLVSAESFLGDQNFRRQLNELLPTSFKVHENPIIASKYEVIYAIAIARDSAETNCLDLPFFSKVTFMETSKRLKMLGYKLSLLWINNIKKISKEKKKN